MEEHIFRAYDVRGVFNVELNAATAAEIGIAFGTYLNGKARVFVARDTRTSSEIIEKAFAAGLASTGCEVYSAGLLPIPTANFKISRGGYDAGAYITASHNPPEYNGVRFRHEDGSGYTEENEKVKNIFLGKKFKLASWNKLGSIYSLDADAIIREHVNFLKDRLAFGEKKLSVALDTGNGASCLIAPQIFRELGFEVATLNAQCDGTFPGRPSEPSEETLDELKKFVVMRDVDFGAGYDGDGDRVVFVDDKGRVVQTEKIGIIMARELLKKKKGTIIANVSCSMIVEKEIEKLGGKVRRVRVGDVFVCEAIKKYGALFAMETSAHYFFPEFYIFDDPVLISLKLAEILSRSDAKLSELAERIPSYPIATMNFSCPDEIKFKVMNRIAASFKERGYRLDSTDGAKVIFKDGWALLRPSNTSPIIRASVEAETRERLEELKELVQREFEAAKRNLF